MAEYKMEELLPIVGQLAEKYTGYEHTSITYEKAEQLMEAVLYCIEEMKTSRENAVDTMAKLDAQQAYEIGKNCVEEKVKTSLKMYNEIISQFEDYGNVCLGDTVRKGLPQFFKWYDVQFQPQNTILTLDYPVLRDISQYVGIDKIYCYLCCIRIEQKFLRTFPENFVKGVLLHYNCDYINMTENLCEILLETFLGCALIRKTVAETNFEFSAKEYSRLETLLLQCDLDSIKKNLKEITQIWINQYYENDKELFCYFLAPLDGIAIRLRNAAENHVLDKIL